MTNLWIETKNNVNDDDEFCFCNNTLNFFDKKIKKMTMVNVVCP